jgi:hypothetical protein
MRLTIAAIQRKGASEDHRRGTNVWLVHSIEVYDLIVIYLHTLHTIPNKLAIELACVAVCPIHLNSFLYQLKTIILGVS